MITTDDILKLTRQLLPTGRAWRLSERSQFRKLIRALGKSEARAFNFATDTLYRILPDTNNFSSSDATEWERRLNIYTSGYIPLSTRKATIQRKYQFPGGFLNRQNYRYLEAQLQLAGYNVTVKENYSPLNALSSSTSHSSETKHGVAKHGAAIIQNEICANSVDKGELFEIDTYKGVFFVEGEIPFNAIKAFRQLILTLKPVNTVALLKVTYSNKKYLAYMNGNNMTTMNGIQLIPVQ